MGSSHQTTTSNQTHDPYAPAVPAVNQELSGVQSYLSNPSNFQAYSGPRVAQMTGQTQQGLRDLGSNAYSQPSQDYYQGVIGGQYLNQGNPYQDAVDKSITASVMPSINNAFSAAGLTGSTLNQTALAQGLENGIAQSHYGNYQNERGLQQQAAQLAPQLAQTQAQNEITSGQMGEQYTQANLDAARQAYYEKQQAAFAPYANASPIINQAAGLGGTTSGTQTTASNPTLGQQILGGALIGGSLLGAPLTGGSSLAFGSNTLGGMIGNAAQGAPSSYGSSWSPWVRSFD